MSQRVETSIAHPRVCPFFTRVGLVTSPVFQPDGDHRCALTGIDIPIRRDVQVRYCLGGRYVLCPTLVAQATPVTTIRSTPPRGLWALAFLAMVMGLLAVGLSAWHGQRRLSETPAMATAPTPQTRASVLVMPEAIITVPTPTPTSMAPPSPLTTPTASVEATAEISFMALELPPTPLPRSPTTHLPDRIVAPSIGLDAPVVPVQRRLVNENGTVTEVWEVADYAAGWHESSALPGQAGNIVLSGHHNIKGQVFRDVERLKPGDEVVLYAGGQAFRYVVELKMIVKEQGEPLEVRQKHAQWIGPFPDERLTLVTCWPYTSNTHRVIVVAWPVSVLAPRDRPIPPAGRP
jgi:sortase A